jgi:ribosomal protein L2
LTMRLSSKKERTVVADALSRASCGTLSTMTVSSHSTTLLEAIKQSWQNVQLLIKELTLQPNSHPHYSWVNQLLCRKGKLVVGQHGPLQT